MGSEPKAIPGPHPHPHAPRAYTPPPNATDAHCHIFGPAATFPFAPDRAYTPPDAGIDDFEVLQRRLGLSRAVFVQASCHGTDNAAMLDALRRGAGRYAGVAMIDESFSDAAIGAVSTQRAEFGAVQNRLEHTLNNLAVYQENLTASESRIRDVDMAAEMVEFTELQILQQAGTSMLAQAQQSGQSVLKLLG